MSVILRAQSRLLSAAQMVSMVPDLPVERSWDKGEVFAKRVSDSAGFHTVLSELDDARKGIVEAAKALAAHAAALAKLTANGVFLEVDVALFLTEERILGVEISPALAGLAASCGIVLCVTAYPTADE